MTLSFVQPRASTFRWFRLVPAETRFGHGRKRGAFRGCATDMARSGHLAGVAVKIGWKPPLEKGYSATSRRDSASFLIRDMKVSRGMAPKSLPDRSRTATLP